MTILPPMGWYPDPGSGGDRQRFWTGTNWSKRVRHKSRIPESWESLPTETPAPDSRDRRPDRTPTVSAPASRAAGPSSATDGGGRPDADRRFIGDADVGGRPLSRLFDGFCYVVTGLVLIAIAGQPDQSGWPALLGLLAALYGCKVAFGSGTYWVSYWIYIITIGVLLIGAEAVLGG